MSDITELTRQRDALDAQIRAAQQDDDSAYDDALVALHRATLECAAFNELDVRESQRKNVITVHLDDGWLSVHFARPAGEHATGLTVRTRGGITAEFPAQLPPARALTGYLNGLIEHDRASMAADVDRDDESEQDR